MYNKHVSLDRIRYERIFALNVNNNEHNLPMPNAIIIKEPAIFMFDQLLPILKV